MFTFNGRNVFYNPTIDTTEIRRIIEDARGDVDKATELIEPFVKQIYRLGFATGCYSGALDVVHEEKIPSSVEIFNAYADLTSAILTRW